MIPSCISSRTKDLFQRALPSTSSKERINKEQTNSDKTVSDASTSNNQNTSCVILDESGQSINCEIVKVSSVINNADNCSDIYFTETSNVDDIGLNINDVNENNVGLVVELGFSQSVDKNENNHGVLMGLNSNNETGKCKNPVVEDNQHIDPPNVINSSVSADMYTEARIVTEHDINNSELKPSPITAGKKRRKFQTSVQERKIRKLENLKLEQAVQPLCNNCKKKCSEKIDDVQRTNINKQFWDCSWSERRGFILNSCTRSEVKRRTTSSDQKLKQNTFKYFLKDSGDDHHEVCKVFYLRTLGYKKTNDRVLHDVLTKTPKGNITPPSDKRGKQPSVNKGPHVQMIEHIETFNPTISHYRREHAPNVRYLPSDVTITFMHCDFITKNPELKNKVSYELYRQIVKKQKISFASLRHEECETCEEFKLHDHDKSTKDENCKIWSKHKELVTKSREKYKQFSEGQNDSLVFSADLQKVIMLPRIDMFKRVLFTPRLIAYHETFAPVDKRSGAKPHAILWHEAITGRNKEDIVSAFYAFLKKNRDGKTFVLWLDNCSSQNKNWCLFTFLIYAVNSSELSADEITLLYFEPGHSFMSADSFHHQVELSLKKQKKTYDFEDFVSAVSNANSGRVEILRMEVNDIYEWPDCSSQPKLKVTTGRPYLKDIVEVKAVRGEYTLQYKSDYDEKEFKTLDFLKKKCMKNIPLPKHNERPKGFPSVKRDCLLKELRSVLPENRRTFWENLLDTL